MRFSYLILLLFVGSLVTGRERLARAQPLVAAPAPASESDRLIERALELRQEGRDADALPLFQRANALGPNPRACAQLALANQALGNWVEAERGLRTALEATDDPWIVQRRAALEKALATVTGQLGWLEIEADPPGAEVSINETIIGVTPLAGALRVPAGQVNLKITARGRIPAVRLVLILAGERAHEALILPLELGSRAVPQEDRRATTPTAPPKMAAPERSEAPSPSKTATSRTLAWIALGGGVTLLAGGAAANVARESDVASWNSPTCLKGTGDRNQNCSQYQSAANTAEALTVAGYVAGGAFALTSLVLFLRSPNDRAGSRSALVPRCGLGVWAVSCAGSF